MNFIFSAFLGLALGSFANVCIYRLPEDESLFRPKSHCPRCQSPIRWRDNIPVLSYLFLRGRCRTCRNPISRRYPAVEIAMAALFLLNQFVFQNGPLPLILVDILTFYLLTISIIDYQHKIIPNELSLSLIVLGWLSSFLNPFLGPTPLFRFLHSIAAALSGGLLLLALAWLGEKIFRKEALGGGDIKYIAGLGAVLGWQGVFGSLFIGSLTGGLIGLMLLCAGKKGRGDTLPFGPFLSLGAYLLLFIPKNWIFLIFP